MLEDAGGPGLRDEIFAAGGVTGEVPSDGLIDEAPVAAVHQALRRQRPDAAVLARQAGARTADYIIANRIPGPVVRLLKALPRPLAAPLLTRAIVQHAWTFAGSGRFTVAARRPLAFALQDNPVVRGEQADHPLCDWHCGVFERLYRVLVSDRLRVRETTCCAAGAPSCRFEVAPRP